MMLCIVAAVCFSIEHRRKIRDALLSRKNDSHTNVCDEGTSELNYKCDSFVSAQQGPWTAIRKHDGLTSAGTSIAMSKKKNSSHRLRASLAIS
jgi:hypothetical protein